MADSTLPTNAVNHKDDTLLVRKNNPVVALIKILWLGCWLFFATILVTFPILIAGYFTSTGNFAFVLSRIWAWIILSISGARLKIEGKSKIDKNRTYIIISNHQSHFDGPAIAARLGIQFRWVAKQELLKIPIFGNALYGCRNIFIDRRDKEKAVRSIQEGIDRLPKGVSVVFFAEGTRSENGKINAFKKGGFAAAIEKGLPILPITVNGTGKALPKGSLVFNSTHIEIIVGDPIETTGLSLEQLEELMDKTKEIIVSNFHQI